MIVSDLKNENGKSDIYIDSRERLKASGVKEVFSFDDKKVISDTNQGILTIKGQNLHIERIDLESGELQVKGKIDIISYIDAYSRKNGSILKKLFK